MPFLYQLVENHFGIIKQLKSNSDLLSVDSRSFKDADKTAKAVNMSINSMLLVPRVIMESIMKKLANDPEVRPLGGGTKELALRDNKLTFKVVALIIVNTLKSRNVLLKSDKKMIKGHQKFKEQMAEYEKNRLKLAPEVEGRSILIQNEAVS